jgi:16S rRNA (guanine(966)-N(2))-methyltransferase RsmD
MTTRPTSDRVKESLFNILGSRIDFAGIRALDVCAGTGALGIEALSRGAASCCFFEADRSVAALLDKNLASINCRSKAEIMAMDAIKGLQSLACRKVNFDLVFFDPPYDSGLYAPVLDIFSVQNLLSAHAILVAECSTRNQLQESYGGLKRFDRRVYGTTAIELFALEE